MAEEREFLNFMLAHPEFYPLVKSELMLSILETLSSQAASENQLAKALKMEKDDVSEVIEMFKKLKLIGKVNVSGRVLYYASDIAKEFLEKYKTGRKGFGVLEKQ